MANAVFAISDDKIFAGIVTSGCGNTGIAGKLSLAIPTILYVFRSARICTQWFSSSLKRISPSGSNRTSSRSFFAGIVPEPSFFTFASQAVRMESSRSVAVSVTLLPTASHRLLPRIGIVVFRSTTPCVRLNSWSRSNFFTLNSIAGFPPPEGAHGTAASNGYCTLFYCRYKDSSSSRRCGNEEIARSRWRRSSCAVHAKTVGMRIERRTHRETATMPLQERNHPQGARLLHKGGIEFYAG